MREVNERVKTGQGWAEQPGSLTSGHTSISSEKIQDLFTSCLARCRFGTWAALSDRQRVPCDWPQRLVPCESPPLCLGLLPCR